jgi:hypothetical protein
MIVFMLVLYHRFNSMSRKEGRMNEQMFNPDAQAPNKVGPFLPGLKARGILGRFGDEMK